jgi:hypothetical protein
VYDLNTKYGKLVDTTLIYAPNVLTTNGKVIVSPFESDYIQAGYLPIIMDADLPYKEGFEITDNYAIVDEQQTPEGETIPRHIKRTQTYVVIPDFQPTPSLADVVDGHTRDIETLTGCVLEMSELVYV